MRYNAIFLILLFFMTSSCKAQEENNSKAENIKKTEAKKSKLTIFLDTQIENSKPSISSGQVSKGKLVNGKLMPFSGKNYCYFDTNSYINSRAFVHQKVKTAVLNTYKTLETTYPERQFCIMECSHKEGGKLFPHRTHQNGLSIDFMVPLVKNNEPCYDLDKFGANHYWLDFNNKGEYTKDTSISIDFNTLAGHILALETANRKEGIKIKKVLFKIELKALLFSTENGKILLQHDVYFAQKLEPIINDLHDDHYHIDFELLPEKTSKMSK